MDKRLLYAYLRRSPFGGRLTQEQVDGVESLLDAFDTYYPEPDVRHVANVLAQVFHETGGRMVPVRETFATSDRQAINRLQNAYDAGKLRWVSSEYWNEGYFGRGQIQITHKTNYAKLGNRLGYDLVNNPSLALQPKVSARIAVVGMMEGLFVPGHDLKRYFDDDTDDPKGARRIVNGTDKAGLVASYHQQFLDALMKAATSTFEEVSHTDALDPEPDLPPPPAKEEVGSIGALLLALLGAASSGDAATRIALVAVAIIAVAVALWFRMRRKK